MEISFERLKTALTGAVYYEPCESCLKPRRFTKNQIEKFIKFDVGVCKALKSGAGAGMKLDFYTNSSTFKMDVNCFPASSKPFCFFDFLIDGKFYKHLGEVLEAPKTFSVEIDLPKGSHRVTIYFPNLLGVDVLGVQIDDGAEFTPVQKKANILFTGDSITQGYTAEYSSKTYVNILSQHYDANVVNQAIGGARFDYTDLDENLNFNPSTIFVAYGTNDWSKGVDIEKNAFDYFTKLKSIYPNCKIFAILPIWRGDLKVKEQTTKCSFDKMHAILQNAIEKVGGITVIDGRKLVPEDVSLFMSDTLHPIESGFEYYAKNLIKELKELGHAF